MDFYTTLLGTSYGFPPVFPSSTGFFCPLYCFFTAPFLHFCFPPNFLESLYLIWPICPFLFVIFPLSPQILELLFSPQDSYSLILSCLWWSVCRSQFWKHFMIFFFFLMWLHGAFLSSVSEKADADAGSLSWPLCPDMRKQKHTFLTDFVPLIQKLLIIHTRKPVNFSQTNNKKCISSMNLLFSGFQSGDGLHVGGHGFSLQGSNLFLCHKEIIHRFLFIKRTFN